MRVIEKTTYLFSELSDNAKENARQWYRESNCDGYFVEYIFKDATNIGEILGIDIQTKRVQLMNGSHRYDPTIYYSGFSSQGDGACFEGSYSYKKGALKAIKAYAPQDQELHRIAKGLQDLQRRYFYSLRANMKHSGHYCHSGCMRVSTEYTRDDSRELPENDLTELMRDFADWIYKQLEKEYDYQNSDSTIDENIISNGYEFTESGESK